MDIQGFVDSIEAMASVYAFDTLPDGSFSEIRLMAVNKGFAGLFTLNPNAPEFKPGMPYKYFFHDVNFESFCYRCASTKEPLYSYVNAHGAWLSGLYFPVAVEEKNTVYCCYILKFTKEIESDEMAKRPADISNAVLNISIKLHKSQDFYRSMAETAGEIRKLCGSEKCSIVLVDKSEKSCTFINEDGENREYLESLADSMSRTPYEMAMAWENDLAGSDCLLLDDLSIVKERDRQWYESLISRDISSIVLYAVKFNEDLVGFIWSANFDVNNMLRIKETLELTTFFIGAIIANRQLLGKLEVMSMVDMLTGVKNRNAMNKRVDGLMQNKTAYPDEMGVVFVDINGLKVVNDEQGHDAGDKLLKKAAALLKIAFEDHEIYRAGGDEFVIFCPNITASKLEHLIVELKQLAADTHDVSFAVGSDIFEREYDICRSMQLADERMYNDKKEYYRLHPDKKRHSRNEKQD